MIKIKDKIKIGITGAGLTAVIVAGFLNGGTIDFNYKRIKKKDYQAMKTKLLLQAEDGHFDSYEQFKLWIAVADYEAKKGKLKNLHLKNKKDNFLLINNKIK